MQGKHPRDFDNAYIISIYDQYKYDLKLYTEGTFEDNVCYNDLFGAGEAMAKVRNWRCQTRIVVYNIETGTIVMTQDSDGIKK